MRSQTEKTSKQKLQGCKDLLREQSHPGMNTRLEKGLTHNATIQQRHEAHEDQVSTISPFNQTIVNLIFFITFRSEINERKFMMAKSFLRWSVLSPPPMFSFIYCSFRAKPFSICRYFGHLSKNTQQLYSYTRPVQVILCTEYLNLI